MDFGGQRAADDGWDFFVSYTAEDQAWAEWISWQLEGVNFRVLVQAWDMVAGSNWTTTIQDGIRRATRTVALVSNAYLRSVFGQQEWQATWLSDPEGVARRLLPVRIENCARPGVLGQMVAVDLFGLAADAARGRLLTSIQGAVSGRAKPAVEPNFPGSLALPTPPQAPSPRSAPAFPGRPADLLMGRHRDGGHGLRTRGKREPEKVGEPAPADPSMFRALLVGVSEYEDERLAPLPWIPTLVDDLARGLEKAGYRAEIHDRSRTGATAIRAAAHSFLTSATAGETLLLYFAGYGVHHAGRDFLVPTDAPVDYQPFWELCVPLDWIKAISRGTAGSVLVVVDAAVGYDETIAEAVTEPGWSTGRLITAPGTAVAYLFGGSGVPEPSATLAQSLMGLLSDGLVPVDLDQLEHLLRHRLSRPPRGSDAAGQSACSLQVVRLCDPRRFRPFPVPSSADADAPDHEWVTAARRHAAWSLALESPAGEQLRDATIDLVARLGAERDRHGALLAEDPWREPELALRMTKRVEFLLTRLPPEPAPLTMAEVALLVTVPFLYEALWTLLVARATDVEPTRLDFQGASGDRMAFGAFARLHPRLLRRAERARQAGDEDASAAIGWWLLHRWVAKARPDSYLSGTLSGLLVTTAVNPLANDVFRPGRIAEILKALRSEPAFLGRTDRPGALGDLAFVAAATPQEMPLRERVVGYLLAISQRMAIEPVALPDVVAEHLGVADPLDLDDLRNTIRRAEWQQRGRTARALAATCRHQALQVALERHAATLDLLLAEAHRTIAEPTILAVLPTHATADNVTAEMAGGRQMYSVAGAQFRMAEDKVQELLMGEQLYTNRGLAVRELYQNALDACRYRRAREEYRERTTGERSTWQGRIRVRQGFESDGSPYLECEDNGVGMGIRELIEVFAEAGTRSVDMPEVVEEMARWSECKPPVEFHPNSRFGVGVLSYFMIADEITINTCRAGIDGVPGRQLRVTIAGPGNLFRVQDLGPGRAAGTTVRLHLSRRPGETPVSSVDILRRILWIAEFDTSATEGAISLTWMPGKLADFAPVGTDNPLLDFAMRITEQIVGTSLPVWWCNGQGAILVDGLWVGSTAFGFIVNLTGGLAPDLAVDRNKIREFPDEPAMEELVVSAVPALLASEAVEMSLEWMAALADERPLVADAVQAALLEEDKHWRAAGGATVPVSAVGCFSLDGEILEQSFRSRVRRRRSPRNFPDFVVVDRNSCWRAALRSEDPAGAAVTMAWPSDMRLLGLELGDRPRRDVYRDLADTLFRSGRLRRSPAEVVERLCRLQVVPPSLKGALISEITAADMRLLSHDFEGKSPISGDVVSLGHSFAASQQTGRPLREVVDRYREMGFTIHPEPDPSASVEALDVVLLSRNMTGVAPWLRSTWVTSMHLRRAALHTGRSVDEVRGRFAELGYPSQPVGVENATHGDIDAVILQAEFSDALQARPLSIGFIYFVADATGLRMEEVIGHFRCLGLPVARSIRAGSSPLAQRMTSVERWVGDRTFFRAGIPVGRSDIAWMAKSTGRSPQEVASLVNGFGLTAPAFTSGADTVWRTLDNKEVQEFQNLLFMDRVSFHEIIGTAHVLNRPPREIAEVLTRLGIATPKVGEVELTANDATLLSVDLDGIFPWLGGLRYQASGAAHVFAASVLLKQRPADLAARLDALGVAVPELDGWNASPVSPPSSLLLANEGDPDRGYLADGVVPAVHVLREAAVSGRRPVDLANELERLGFDVAPVTDAELTHEDDLTLRILLEIPEEDDDEGTRPDGELGVAAVLATARLRGREPAGVAVRIEALGLQLPVNCHRLDGARVGADDLVLLSYGLDGRGPWLPDGAVPVGHVLAAAGRTGSSPAAIVERLTLLGLGDVELPNSAPRSVDAVDLVLVARDLDGNAPWLAERVVPLAHVLRAACVLGCDVAEVVERYGRLGFEVPDGVWEIDGQERNDITVAFHGADTSLQSLNKVTIAQVLGVAEYSGRAPAEVARSLAGIGLPVASLGGLADLPAGRLTPVDAFVLSADLNGRGPWLGDPPVSLAHIVAAAGHLRRSPGEVARQLAGLGCVVPQLTTTAEVAVIDGFDRALMELVRTEGIGYADRPISRAEVLIGSFRFRWTPVRIADRLIDLGFSVPSRDDLADLASRPPAHSSDDHA
ncbi:TIR domain-containing protein [Frankia sp. CNm7]|uniref:TIR domain-containing protein n=1 Tax=Frankia nepalensis TaxID=1836974 RepID=A0A937RIF1_9ACTN|nr:TIR domain-containing protein [Frankia nepalensis]MBL7497381.1 TIR domain-containing protein [Frankia nepalensis]MBL7512771.1 TIR domain-containing protein [Frankia nepalensis]MBL7522511.1 TIR domain-containing protein [Frankia nepalensis]MBL7629419.1 TIR domain-containing protein [Frankia nepalensis]